MHTATLFSYLRKQILIDAGESWLGKLDTILPKPDAIFLTHAHPDHAYGLQAGAPCPVFATQATWEIIDSFPIPQALRRVIAPGKKRRIGKISIEPFSLLHSLRCPAVGFRITCGKTKLFYAPDVAWIEKMEQALHKIQVYIGDGATITRNMIRKTKDTGAIFGHTTIRAQLTWCHKMGVPKMIVTHCGSDIVAHEMGATKKVKALAKERDVEVEIAYDGMSYTF